MRRGALPGVLILMFGFAGIITSAILFYLHENGIFFDAFTTGTTIALPELIALNIIVWMLIGGVVAAVKL